LLERVWVECLLRDQTHHRSGQPRVIQRLVDPILDILFSPDGQWLAAKTTTGLRLLDGSRDWDGPKATRLGRDEQLTEPDA
jgi:hypothetical protein